MDNVRGAAWMTAAMLGFAFEDMFIKLLSGSLPTWQIVLIIGLAGALAFGLAARAQGQPLLTRAALSGPVLMRNLGEVVATLGFITAISLIPLSSASAILQATPLAVTFGAAVIFAETVGWRRWTAIFVGFFGVVLIIRPGTSGFDVNSLFAIQGAVGLVIRDLATRRISSDVSTTQVSLWAFAVLIPAALLLKVLSGQPAVVPLGTDWAYLGCIVPLGLLSYYAIVAAMRVGDISFVTPFRYSRILFALILGVVIFAERPDAVMLTGAALIVGSGLFTLWRERKQRTAT